MLHLGTSSKSLFGYTSIEQKEHLEICNTVHTLKTTEHNLDWISNLHLSGSIGTFWILALKGKKSGGSLIKSSRISQWSQANITKPHIWTDLPIIVQHGILFPYATHKNSYSSMAPQFSLSFQFMNFLYTSHHLS